MEMTWAVSVQSRPYPPLQHLLCSPIPQTWSETTIQVVFFVTPESIILPMWKIGITVILIVQLI
jgi:hypothetical protein